MITKLVRFWILFSTWLLFWKIWKQKLRQTTWCPPHPPMKLLVGVEKKVGYVGMYRCMYVQPACPASQPTTYTQFHWGVRGAVNPHFSIQQHYNDVTTTKAQRCLMEQNRLAIAALTLSKPKLIAQTGQVRWYLKLNWYVQASGFSYVYKKNNTIICKHFGWNDEMHFYLYFNILS